MTTESRSQRQVLVAFGAIMLATLLAALDQTIVATALPQIVADLHGFKNLSWVVTAYLLSTTVTVPLYGKLSDLYGRRRLFIVSITVFLLGSALCGTAQSMGELIAFRALQGVGAGGLIPLSQAAIADLFSPGSAAATRAMSARCGHRRGRRAAAGRDADRRRVVALDLLHQPPARCPGAGRGDADDEEPHAPRALDRLRRRGAAEPRRDLRPARLRVGRHDLPVGLAEVLGAGDRRRGGARRLRLARAAGAEPLVPLGLFRMRVFAVSSLAALGIGAVLFGITIYVPVYMQGVLRRRRRAPASC